MCRAAGRSSWCSNSHHRWRVWNRLCCGLWYLCLMSFLSFIFCCRILRGKTCYFHQHHRPLFHQMVWFQTVWGHDFARQARGYGDYAFSFWGMGAMHTERWKLHIGTSMSSWYVHCWYWIKGIGENAYVCRFYQCANYKGLRLGRLYSTINRKATSSVSGGSLFCRQRRVGGMSG